MMMPKIDLKVYTDAVNSLTLQQGGPDSQAYSDYMNEMSKLNSRLTFAIAVMGTRDPRFAQGMVIMYKIIEAQMIANATAELESLVK